VTSRPLPPLAFAVALFGVAASIAEADLVTTLSCAGRALTYTPDYSAQLGTVEPFEFEVVFDLARGRLLRAPVRDALEFEMLGPADAVFFSREALVGGGRALEWISISRISGRYAHFIAPLEPRAGGLGTPILITAADCSPAGERRDSR
jgi:hypothetical protein